jgi:peptidoglycan hydrolase-like protein with peptidoglycan-binding domain
MSKSKNKNQSQKIMNKTINALRIGLISAGAMLMLVIVPATTVHAAISSQMSVGSTGSDVTQLQQFLATNSLIYPAGTVSGYYGALTQNALTQFQATYGIAQVGNVGPITEAKVNNLMASGLGLNTSAPVMSSVYVSQVGANSAVVNWTTNEAASGQVFYDVNAVQANEETSAYQVPWIGGTQANANNNPSVSNTQSVQLTGLQPNTTYYYIARSIDKSGNISMTLNQSFQTN